jgi:lipopolysaccharide transport system permease protein
MIAFMIYYWAVGAEFQITAYILLFPVVVLIMAILGLSLGLIISAMTTKYRDLTFLVTFGVQLLMYGTTVIYPLSAAPEKYKWLIELNPMTGIIETLRLGFLGQGTFSWGMFTYSVICTLILFISGLIIFNRVERTFVDTI